MKEELRSRREGSLCSLQDRDEDRDELVAFLSQRRQLLCTDDAGFQEQFEPVGAFLNLAQRVAAFCDKLGFASRAKRFSVISANRSSGAEQLLSEHLPFRCFWQRGKRANNPKRESLGPITQIRLKARPLLRICRSGSLERTGFPKPGLVPRLAGLRYGLRLPSAFFLLTSGCPAIAWAIMRGTQRTAKNYHSEVSP
jgi:hypothetical protein